MDTVIHGKLGLDSTAIVGESKRVQIEAIRELMSVVESEFENGEHDYRFEPESTRGGMEMYRMNQRLFVSEEGDLVYEIGSGDKGKKTEFLEAVIDYLEEDENNVFERAFDDVYSDTKNFKLHKRKDELEPFIEDGIDTKRLKNLYKLVSEEELPASY